ncbi:MAG: AAA family ATPase [Cyanobacteria bacterium]|nr:AAA family ATPase [Cyanobacteriota bacterium]
MQITAVINYKGGVGKTSVTANLAAKLAWLGYLVNNSNSNGNIGYKYDSRYKAQH